MRSVARRTGLFAIAGLCLLAVISLAVWLGPTASDNPAVANHQAAIGIDTDTTGNSALALGTIQACRAITLGQVIDVDLFVTGLDDLAAFDIYIKYDKNIIKFTKPGDNSQTAGSDATRFMLQNAQGTPPGNSVNNVSDPLPDSNNDGIYNVSAYDSVVIPGVEDPDPSGHTHKDGVLVRLQLQGIGTGYSMIQISPFTQGPGTLGPTLTTSTGGIVNDGNGDSFIDSVTNGNIVVATGGSCTDNDGDGVPDSTDNCPATPNSNQANFDGDSMGDACDIDDDNDGLIDTSEPASCTAPMPAHAGSLDPDCDGDNVSDGNLDPDGAGAIVAGPDNCITTSNTTQTNTDGDAQGDACDPDDDNDTVLDGADNCPTNANSSQANMDGDSMGDACDEEDDGDGFSDAAEANVVTNPLDNCGNPSGGGQPYSMSWPADLLSSGPSANTVDISDIVTYIAPTYRLTTNPGDPNFDIRWDISPGSGGAGGDVINIVDLATLVTLAPSMFGGQRALLGPACTP